MILIYFKIAGPAKVRPSWINFKKAPDKNFPENILTMQSNKEGSLIPDLNSTFVSSWTF